LPTKRPTFSRKTNIFGTTVTLATKDGSYSQTIAENLPVDPFKKRAPQFEGGYQFRSPNIPLDEWEGTLKSLSTLEGKFAISAEVDTESSNVTAKIRIAEKEDAAMFAWTNVSVWQKWSDAQEAELKESIKDGKKTKVFVDKDGKLKARVKVTSLGS
jgi:hypothetical protein